MTIRIIVHYASGTNTPRLPTNDIARLFATCGVPLSFVEATAEVGDPKTRDGYEELAARIQPTPPAPLPGAPAHLIVGREWEDEGGKGVNGLLVTRNRGFAAVMTGSNDIGYSAGPALLQSAAHEVGHMLNLRHRHADEPYPTTMRPAFARKNLSGAWSDHAAKYDEARPDTLDAYPFSRECHEQLEDPGSVSVLPWGDPFPDPLELAMAGDLSVRLERDDRVCVVGGHFAFELHLENSGKEPIEAPAELGIDFGAAKLRVTRPDGGFYDHRPRVLLCGSEQQSIRPGDAAVACGVVLDGPGAAVFPVPGDYRIECGVDGAGGTAIDVHVREDPVLGGYDPGFSRFLADGAPPRNRRYMRRLRELIDSGLDRGVRSHFALLRARHLKRGKQARELLDSIDFDELPRALAHAGSIIRLRTMRRGKQTREEAHRMLDGISDLAVDAPLRRVLGWIANESGAIS